MEISGSVSQDLESVDQLIKPLDTIGDTLCDEIKNYTPDIVLGNQTYSSEIESTQPQNNGENYNLTGPEIIFRNLIYEVNVKEKKCGMKKTKKIILNNISGIIPPGLNALMGPSGSGKSTLLDTLAGRKDPKFLTSCEVLIDNKLCPKDFKYKSGYCQQDDMVHGLLTCEENILYAAHLRLSSTGQKDIRNRVEDIMKSLGIEKLAKIKVGTEFQRGVSGGEKRRVAIAQELVKDPNCIFLDEPTTGLDSRTAHEICVKLKELSGKGSTIIMSLHQPKYGIYELFDSITLICGGKIVYNGKGGQEPLDYFEKLSFKKVEKNNNSADFYIDIMLGAEIKIKDDKLTLAKNWENSDPYNEIKTKIDSAFKNINNEPNNKKDKFSYATSSCKEIYLLCKRTLTELTRNFDATVVQGLVYLFFAITLGLVYFQVDTSIESGAQNRLGLFFFCCLQVTYVNLGAVDALLNDRRLYINERAGGWYRVINYFFSKLFCEIVPTKVLPIVFFLPITYFMIGLRKTVAAFFYFELLLILTTICAAAVVFCVSASVSSFASANTIISIVFIFMMVFSGYLINLNSMFNGISWLRHLSFFRYCWNGLLVNEMPYITFCPKNNFTLQLNLTDIIASNQSTLAPIPQVITRTCVPGTQYLVDLGISYSTPWDYWSNALFLAIIAFLLLILSYVQLRRVSIYT